MVCTKPGCGGNDPTMPAPRQPSTHFDAVLTATAAWDCLYEQIVTVAASPHCSDSVDRLGCLRGISALTALALSVEIGDRSRFSGSSIGAYVGLIATERSSGPPVCRGRSPRLAMLTCGGC